MNILRLLILFPILLLLTACDTAFLGNVPQNPSPVVNATNITEAEPVNITTNETPIDVVPETPLYIPSQNNLIVYVMDVKGQSILVMQDENSLLIDSGTEEDSANILKNLRNLGIEKLDNLIISNTMEGSIGGLPYIIIQTSPANVYDSGNPSQSSSYVLYNELIKETPTINKVLVSTDKLLTLGSAFIRIFVVYDDGSGFLPDSQDNSIVSRITYQSNSILAMSNCGFQCLEKLKNEDLKSDVLIIDGSCDSTTLTFIQKVNPKAVVSTNEVCKETEDRFKFLNIPLYYTLKHGDIKITADGTNFELKYLKIAG